MPPPVVVLSLQSLVALRELPEMMSASDPNAVKGEGVKKSENFVEFSLNKI